MSVDYVPPWIDARFIYVRRVGDTFDVIDTGGPTDQDFPAFVATCEDEEMAKTLVEALDVHA